MINPLSWLNTQVGNVQRRWPKLRKLDDANWKTLVWHTVFAMSFGYLISLLPYVTPIWGMRIVLGLYLWRELGQEKPDKWDVLVPWIVVEAWNLWR